MEKILEMIITIGLIAALPILLNGAWLIVQDKQKKWESRNNEERHEQDNY